MSSQTCHFHAGFGESDLTRVFWESRDSSNSAVLHSCVRKEGRGETVFQPQRLAILGISSALFAVGCLSASRNRAA